MKKVLYCVCICLLLFGGRAYAADYTDVLDKVTEISAALENSDNVDELLGEAVILMIENDILTSLEEKGETACATALKASADEALDAVANDSEDERETAIAFCDKLSESISVLLSYESHIGFVETVDSTEFITDIQKASYARCDFVGTQDSSVLKFFVAKYNKNTDAMEKVVEVVTVGEGVAENEKRSYSVALDLHNENYYYRIFLWDGATLRPVLDSQRIG